MNFPCKVAFLLPILALSLGGCTSQSDEMVRGVAASLVAARSFDRAKSAIVRDDAAALERAGNQMRRAALAGSNPRLAGVLASELTLQANLLLAQASQVSGAEKNRLSEKSNLKYRAALAFAPQNQAHKSLDARTLNALGYFLADKGSTHADFERAAALTRAAYQNWDMSGKFTDSNELGRAVNAQDSYAWALFKLGKYEEALAQQKKVWDIVSGMGMADVTADIPFHLGEIYRALGQNKRARVAYEIALRLTITDETRVLVEGGLKSLDLAQV